MREYFISSKRSMLAFSVADRAGLRIVTVGGDIDGMNADAFESACSDNGRSVVVDLLTCPYIDSTGLTALIRANRRNPLTLVLEPACRIYRIFAITELLSFFTIVATLEQASAAPAVGAAAASLA